MLAGYGVPLGVQEANVSLLGGTIAWDTGMAGILDNFTFVSSVIWGKFPAKSCRSDVLSGFLYLDQVTCMKLATGLRGFV